MRTIRERNFIAFLPLPPKDASRQWDVGDIGKRFGLHPTQIRQIDFIPADGGCVIRVLHNGRRAVPARMAHVAGEARSVALGRLTGVVKAVGGRVTAIHNIGAFR